MVDNSDRAARRSQAERREESERGLVQAAIAVVAEQGVSAATFEAIGLEAGLHRSLVTQRFGSKQGLIDAVIKYLHNRREAAGDEHGIDAMPGLDALLAYTDLFLRRLAEESETRAYFMLLSSAIADSTSLRPAFAAEHELVRARIRAFVQKGQAEGGIRPEIDADAVALMVGSLQLGLSIQLLVDPTMNLDPIRETSLASLRLGLEARRR
jgi:AcrR family transcriptional regulator